MTTATDFIASGLIVLRTPLLPAGEIEAWSSGLLSPHVDGDPELEEALVHDRELPGVKTVELVAEGVK